MSEEAASVSDLHRLQRAVVKSLTDRVVQDMADKVPTDAATLGAAIKLLKDNNITADPASGDELTALRDKLKKSSEQRQALRSNVISMAAHDMKAANG